MAPRLAPALVPLNASEPYHATAWLPVEMSPVNRRRIGIPLWTVVMPEICHPLKTPLVTAFFQPPRAISGTLQLYDMLKTWVRSNGSTPQLRLRVSIGSAHAAPSLSLVATVPSALPKV